MIDPRNENIKPLESKIVQLHRVMEKRHARAHHQHHDCDVAKFFKDKQPSASKPLLNQDIRMSR